MTSRAAECRRSGDLFSRVYPPAFAFAWLLAALAGSAAAQVCTQTITTRNTACAGTAACVNKGDRISWSEYDDSQLNLQDLCDWVDAYGRPVRQAATDCTAETGGVTAEVCQQLSSNTFWVCETGPCDASGWVSYGAPAEANDLTAAVVWANVPDANIDGSAEEDEIDHDNLVNFAAAEHVPVRQAATDCTAESGGVTGEICEELDDDNLWICETGPCNAAGWSQYGGGGSSISAGDSDVTVTDSGTGQVQVTVDGSPRGTWAAGGLTLPSGTTLALPAGGAIAPSFQLGVVDFYAGASGTLLLDTDGDTNYDFSLGDGPSVWQLKGGHDTTGSFLIQLSSSSMIMRTETAITGGIKIETNANSSPIQFAPDQVIVLTVEEDTTGVLVNSPTAATVGLAVLGKASATADILRLDPAGNGYGTGVDDVTVDKAGQVTAGGYCITTASGTICDYGLLATAPASCTVGDTYTDTSPAKCWCSATNTWDVIVGTSCT